MRGNDGHGRMLRRPREGGDPCVVTGLDSRLRGNDGGVIGVYGTANSAVNVIVSPA